MLYIHLVSQRYAEMGYFWTHYLNYNSKFPYNIGIASYVHIVTEQDDPPGVQR